MKEPKYCRNCKHYIFNEMGNEWQCWNENNDNDGVPMEEFDSCYKFENIVQ